MTENTFINVKNRSHNITAVIELKKGANGVILAPTKAPRKRVQAEQTTPVSPAYTERDIAPQLLLEASCSL